MLTNTVTLAEMASQSLAAARVLERHGLDYCCGGKRLFEDACREQGLAPQSIRNEIEGAGKRPGAQPDWQTEPLDRLVQHILTAHHAYLWEELPALTARLEKVQTVHGERDPAIARIVQVFGNLRQELEMHLRKEEQVLFPLIERLAAAAGRFPSPPAPFGSIAGPIAAMEHEHSDAGGALAEIHQLTNGYTLPPYACATVKALYDGLQSLQADLHLHIHLENNILFPRAIALEQMRA